MGEPKCTCPLHPDYDRVREENHRLWRKQEELLTVLRLKDETLGRVLVVQEDLEHEFVKLQRALEAERQRVVDIVKRFTKEDGYGPLDNPITQDKADTDPQT